MMNTRTYSIKTLNMIKPVYNNWTNDLQRLISVFADPENNYVYTVAVNANGVPTVRKLAIQRDPGHAREQYKLAKGLVGRHVSFSARKGWASDLWFNEIRASGSLVK
jgi:hypothetical protein